MCVFIFVFVSNLNKTKTWLLGYFIDNYGTNISSVWYIMAPGVNTKYL